MSNKIREVDSENNLKESEEKQTVPEENKSDKLPSINGNLEQREIGYMLGMETESELKKYSDEFDVLLEWAKYKAGDKSDKIEEVKWAIRDLQDKLGTPHMGENNIVQLSRYAALSLESKDVEQKMRKMLGLYNAGE